jgi:hypothetical protein
MYNLDPLGIAAWILILAGCIGLARREMGEAPMSKAPWKTLWAFKYAILILVGGSIWFGKQLLETVGFNEGWPDAISCRWHERELRVDSEYVFYYKGKQQRGDLGLVHMYFLPGDQSALPGYAGGWEKPLTHELWFGEDNQKMIRPEDYPNSKTVQDFYKYVFLPGVHCEGNFSFARKMR